MIARYNKLSLAWGVPGIILQIVGEIMRTSSPQEGVGKLLAGDPVIGFLVTLAGTVLLLVGLAYYAKAKGRSPAWSLMAFLSLVGLIVLACLKDLAPER